MMTKEQEEALEYDIKEVLSSTDKALAAVDVDLLTENEMYATTPQFASTSTVKVVPADPEVQHQQQIELHQRLCEEKKAAIAACNKEIARLKNEISWHDLTLKAASSFLNQAREESLESRAETHSILSKRSDKGVDKTDKN